MKFRLSTWKARHLLVAWVVYWAGLIVATVAPAIPTIWKLSGSGAKGSSNVSWGDQGLVMSLVVDSVETWSRTIPGWTISFWIAVPPLLLFAFWLRAQQQRKSNAPVG